MPLLHGRMQHFLQEKFNAKRRCGNLGGSYDSPPGECYARCGHDRFQSPYHGHFAPVTRGQLSSVTSIRDVR